VAAFSPQDTALQDAAPDSAIGSAPEDSACAVGAAADESFLVGAGFKPAPTAPSAPPSVVPSAPPSEARPPDCAITIYVCVTCRAGRPLDLVPVPGDVLAEATARAAAGTGMTVRRVCCLANCNRGLSAAVRRDGAWTYVFGHLDPANAAAGAAALVEGARLFARAPDGLMPWRGRPDALKRGLVARTPPFDFAGEPG
jgi:predicted metal-binding protein